MTSVPALVRVVLLLCLTVHVACATSQAGIADGASPTPVKTSSLPGGRLRLSFAPTSANSAQEVLCWEETQEMLTLFQAAFLTDRPQIRVMSPAWSGRSGEVPTAKWEARLRDQFLSRFGPTLLPLPERLEQSPLFQALKLSPRYMGAGVREAAREMFDSPVFVASVCLSVLVYFAAWIAPEPLFTKALAATVTTVLAITVGILELTNLALACLKLYRESEAARTEDELEAAAEHFGKAVGGTTLRVLMLVASFGVAKGLPPVPPGSAWTVLGPPRYAVEGGLALGATSTAHLVADGSLILSGVATGEVAQRLCGGLAVCATMEEVGGAPKLSTRYGPPHTRQNAAHNEAIERELAAREVAGHTDLRKNKAQLKANGDPVFDSDPVDGTHFRRPDVSSLRPDGIRHNTNYVSNPRDLKRELDAFEAMKRADPKAIQDLYLLDGTLLRRHVPPGVASALAGG
ncbi:hypothetical protein [Hyalangium rubrum]|uniref:Lipoprotein n=1 Tax=Hyalangium rubrum TaxID=3103134 RepID=A0ABU5H129_9BACT|nr:hypothetical protein [Hyalangium sp. s54d21]MDY7226467.1 hypothetical protein [Hyalangium sp. s54d21]